MTGYEQCFRKSFKIDIESLRISDSSDEERKNVTNEIKVSNRTPAWSRRKFFVDGRLSRKNPTSALNKIFNPVVTKDFEIDYEREIRLRRMVLKEFIEKASDLSTSKCRDLLRKQETEVRDMKREFEKTIKSELEKWKNDLISIRKQEKELVKVLLNLEKVYTSSEMRTEKVRDIQKYFNQRYEELKREHASEASELEKNLKKEMSRVKKDVLVKMMNAKVTNSFSSTVE